jgi:hypothetical protein
MSPRSSDQNPTPGIYEGLLFVSLAAVIMGIYYMIMEMNQNGWKVSGS